LATKMQADRTEQILKGFAGRHRFDRARKAYEAWKAHHAASAAEKVTAADSEAIYADLIERTHNRWDAIARAKLVDALKVAE
jgi:hypothetical protein